MILIMATYIIIFAACLIAVYKTQNTNDGFEIVVQWICCILWPVTIPFMLFIWLCMNAHLFLREKL